MAYRFDSFVFDRERGLMDAGEAIPLEPQVSDLLCYLLENRDRVVTRDELIERIWNGRFVSDAALSTQIRAIRRALSDDRTQQRYIRTHPKRGFQFVAPVELVADDAIDTAIAEPERPRPRRAYSMPMLLAAAALVVAGAIAGWWI